MYNPALPNHYRDVVFTAFVRRRQREEAAAAAKQCQPNALASALSSFPSSALDDGAPPLLAAPSHLHLSAEELHQQRLSSSAALGIESAVEMEKAALEREHQRRRTEGEDARSKISSRLDKLKALAARSKALTSGGGGGGDSAIGASPSTPEEEVSVGNTPLSSSLPAPAAPLSFQRSSLGAGGYVLTGAAALPSLVPSTTTRAVRGRPSSTLLLRYLRSSPATRWSEEQLTAEAAASGRGGGASSSGGESLCAPLLQHVQELSRCFGTVRAMQARVHTAADVSSLLHIAASAETAVLAEQVRLWVRFDSVTEAFKAAESLAKAPTAEEGAAVFSVCFYPTSLFDDNMLELRAEDERAVV